MKIDLNGRDKLVVSGCSFTDGYWMKEKGSWAYYLSNMLGFELHNLGKGGAGNERICHSIITYLETNPEIRSTCIVGVAWSDLSRLSHSFLDITSNRHVVDTVQPQDFLPYPRGGRFQKYGDFGKIFFSDIPFCIFKTYMAINNLITYCERWNIPYFGADAITQNRIKFNHINPKLIEVLHWYQKPMSFDLDSWPQEYFDVITPKWSDRIFKNHLKVLDYNTMMEFIAIDEEKYQKGNTGHPNDVASKLIAESIYEQII